MRGLGVKGLRISNAANLFHKNQLFDRVIAMGLLQWDRSLFIGVSKVAHGSYRLTITEEDVSATALACSGKSGG
jgi:hypothetical protein